MKLGDIAVIYASVWVVIAMVITFPKVDEYWEKGLTFVIGSWAFILGCVFLRKVLKDHEVGSKEIVDRRRE